MGFKERIRALAEALSIEEQTLAKDLGLTKSQLSHYINGRRKVPSELLQKIIDIYGINPLFLFRDNEPLYEVDTIKESGESYKVVKEYTYFPTAISAGLPLEVDGMTESSKIAVSEEFLGRWKNNKEIFFAHVNGESMNRLMQDGSMIGIKPINNIDELKNGDIVVYSVDGDYSIKHYFKYGEMIVFKPNSTIEHKENQYNIKDNIKIHGKVVLSISDYS